MARLLPDAVLLFVDPAQDLPRFAPEVAAIRAAVGARTYVLFDPFHDPRHGLEKTLGEQPITYLKCFGFGESCLPGLARMNLFKTSLAGLLRGELESDLFFERLRRRKDFPFYRRGIEAALVSRGQSDRADRFRRAFQIRRKNLGSSDGHFQELKAQAEAERPQTVGAWARSKPGTTGAAWPSAGGNVWMLDVQPDRMRYLSDRWRKTTIGFEEAKRGDFGSDATHCFGVRWFWRRSACSARAASRFPLACGRRKTGRYRSQRWICCRRQHLTVPGAMKQVKFCSQF